MIAGGWHPAVDGACAPMFQPSQVWTGVSRTPPALLAQALSDPEEPNPAFRIRAMPDQDETEINDTMAPPTDRAQARETQPPGEDDAEALRVSVTMVPAAPSLTASPAPPEYWKAAYDKLVEIHEEQRKDRDARQGREDALVARFAAVAKESSDDNREKLTEAIDRIGTRLGALEETVQAKDAEKNARLAEGESRFAAIELSVTELRGRFDALVAELAKAKADARSPQANPPAQP